jgi:predicted SAM-dependent methyltransferase
MEVRILHLIPNNKENKMSEGQAFLEAEGEFYKRLKAGDPEAKKCVLHHEHSFNKQNKQEKSMQENMKSWDYTQEKLVDTPIEIQNFFKDIDELCKKYNLSISHEDVHGAFIISAYEKENISWLRNATLCIISKER